MPCVVVAAAHSPLANGARLGYKHLKPSKRPEDPPVLPRLRIPSASNMLLAKKQSTGSEDHWQSLEFLRGAALGYFSVIYLSV